MGYWVIMAVNVHKPYLHALCPLFVRIAFPFQSVHLEIRVCASL